MKYLLSDDVLKFKFLSGINQNEAILFYSWYDIRTISDLLKHGEEVRSETNLNVIVEELRRNNIKFDDELTTEELNKRNEERKVIEMNDREIRAKNSFEELLIRKIETLNLPREITRKLHTHCCIDTIKDLIDGSSYIFFQKDTTIFKQTQINRIIDSLSALGLYLNMINPIDGEIEKKDEFKSEDAKPMVAYEFTEPTLIPAKPRKKKVDMKTWDERFEYLKIFNAYFGHLFIPKSFKAEGIAIGEWIQSQRKAYNGTKGEISHEQIEKLESINMSWVGVGRRKDLKNELYTPLNIKDVKLIYGVLYTYYLDGTVKTTNDIEFTKLLKGEEIEETREEIIDIPSEILDTVLQKETAGETFTNEELTEIMKQVFESDLEEEKETTTEELDNNSSDEIETSTIDEETENSTQELSQSVDNQNDTYSLMKKRIEEMSLKRANLKEENERKRALINEYKELIDELETLAIRGLELDDIINNLLGADVTYESEDEIVLSQNPSSLEDLEMTKELLSRRLSEKREENERKQALIDEYRQVEAQLNAAQIESDELDSQIDDIFNPNGSKVKKRGEL